MEVVSIQYPWSKFMSCVEITVWKTEIYKWSEVLNLAKGVVSLKKHETLGNINVQRDCFNVPNCFFKDTTPLAK